MCLKKSGKGSNFVLKKSGKPQSDFCMNPGYGRHSFCITSLKFIPDLSLFCYVTALMLTAIALPSVHSSQFWTPLHISSPESGGASTSLQL